MAPRRVVLKQGRLNPLMQGMDDITTQIRNRAHAAIQDFNKPAGPLASVIPQIEGARQLGDLFSMAFSPVAGAGDVLLGGAADPGAFKPGGDQGQRRQIGGDLASSLVPVPGKAAVDLTGMGLNALMRGGRAIKGALKVADEVNPARRALMGLGQQSETAAPVVAPHSPPVAAPVTPVAGANRRQVLGGAAAVGAAAVGAPLLEHLPQAAATVAPTAVDTALHSMGSNLHEVAAKQWAKVLGQQEASGYANGRSVQKALQLSREATAIAAPAGASDGLSLSANAEAAERARVIARDGILPNTLDDPEAMMYNHIYAAAEHRKVTGPYADSPLSGAALEGALQQYREDPDTANHIMAQEQSPHPQTEAGWLGYVADTGHSDDAYMAHPLYDHGEFNLTQDYLASKGIHNFDQNAGMRGDPVPPNPPGFDPANMALQQQRDWKPGQ